MKNKSIAIRVSESEYNDITKFAKNANLSISEFLTLSAYNSAEYLIEISSKLTKVEALKSLKKQK